MRTYTKGKSPYSIAEGKTEETGGEAKSRINTMKLLKVLAIASMCIYPNVFSQELQKNHKPIRSANPDIIEFNITISMPIDEPGANLTETTSPLLNVGNYSTDGTITSTGTLVTVTFNTTLQSGAVLLRYNVTLRDGVENFSGFVNLTTTITYYTTSFRNETDSSTATVCIGKRERLFVSYTEYNWYIALAVILGFALGALLAFAIADVLLQKWMKSSRATIPGMKKSKDNESELTGPFMSSDMTDLSNVVQSRDVLKSSHLLELIEIGELIAAERWLQSERSVALWTLLNTHKDTDNKAEGPNTRVIEDEIKQKIGNLNQENQESLTKECEKSQARKSNVMREHEIEKGNLRKQMATFETENQEELIALLEKRQLLESQYEEHLAILRQMATERSKGHATQISCEVLEDKLKIITSEYHKKKPDAYALYMERISEAADIIYTRTQELAAWRRQEVTKIRNYETSIRASWNRFGKTVVNSVKTICRELLLDAGVRKNLIAFVKEEMLKMREHFDREMTNMRVDFVKTCKLEKHKYFILNRNHKPRKYLDFDRAAKWMNDNLSKTEEEMYSAFVDQSKYDAFVLNLWNSKFQKVLLSTSDMMNTMKNKVVVMLAQEGASKTATAEFIEAESKENIVDKPFTVTPCRFTEDVSPNQDNSKAENVAFLSYKRIFKRVVDSQLLPVDRSKLDLDIKPDIRMKPKSVNQSLQRLRELIEYHESDIARRKTLSKPPKKRKIKPTTKDEIRTQLESSFEIWQRENDAVIENTRKKSGGYEWSKELLLYEEKLSSIVSSEMFSQWKTKSQLDLLRLDLNALERLMMSMLQLLVSDRKISPGECNTVIQQHRIQTGNLRSASTTRVRRRLEQVTRKRLHSPRPMQLVKENDHRNVESSQIMHHLNTHKAVTRDGLGKLLENTETAKEKFQVLCQLNEQQAYEHRELNLKVIQGLAKAARVPSGEMNACFTLLLHHRKQEEIEKMMRAVFMGENDFGKTKTGLLGKIRELVARQQHRIAENVLRTDDDFAPALLQSSNRLQRIKQPHHVTFDDGSSPARVHDRFSPLPSIRPEPVGRTATPDQHSLTEFERDDSRLDLYKNVDKLAKVSRRTKKRSLKSLSVAK